MPLWKWVKRRLRKPQPAGRLASPALPPPAPIAALPLPTEAPPPPAEAPLPKRPVKVALALQGGGAHGAFTWGVIDFLLGRQEAGAIEIVAISGASAGAMTGTALALGLLDGPAAARRQVKTFWKANMEAARFSPLVSAMRNSSDFNIDDSPLVTAAGVVGTIATPYWGSGEYVEKALEEAIQTAMPTLDELNHRTDGPKLFLGATDIGEGKQVIFQRGDISVDALMASACIPSLFRTRMINGHAFWDGGYMGNPPLSPLLGTDADAVIVVMLNPIRRDDVPPKGAGQILDRLNEITFNASLWHELRLISKMNELIESKHLRGQKVIHLHRVGNDPLMQSLGYASKLAPEPKLIAHLRRHGRVAARRWWEGLETPLDQASSWSDLNTFLDTRLSRMAQGREAVKAT